MVVDAPIKQVKWVEQQTSPTKAQDMIQAIIDGQIKFNQRQHIADWEKDHSISRQHLESSIAELLQQKKELVEIIAEAQAEGLDVQIKGSLEVSIAI